MRHSYYSDRSHYFATGFFALLAGAALGLLFSPRSGKENRARLANWSERMKEELETKMRDTADITKEKYYEIIDELSDRYAKLKDIKKSELDDLADDLKSRWNRIKDHWNE